MLVLGESEVQNGTLSVRKRGQGDLGAQNVEAVIKLITDEVANKTV
jgi:threonyl-tRNA synthetase